jgi:hypothetical protein
VINVCLEAINNLSTLCRSNRLSGAQVARADESCRCHLGQSEGWTVGFKFLGMTTLYRVVDGQLHARVEGHADGISTFDQLV